MLARCGIIVMQAVSCASVYCSGRSDMGVTGDPHSPVEKPGASAPVCKALIAERKRQ